MIVLVNPQRTALQALLDALGKKSVEEREKDARTENPARLRKLEGNRRQRRVIPIPPRVTKLIRSVPKLRENPRFDISQIDD